MGNMISLHCIQCVFPIPKSALYRNLLFSSFEYQFSTSLAFFLHKSQCALLVLFPLAFPPLCGLTCPSSLQV